MNLRHGRHHRQHIYEVSLAGPPEDDRLVGTLQTIEDAERIVEAVNRIAELEAEVARLKSHAEAMARAIQHMPMKQNPTQWALRDYRRDYPGGDHGPDQQGD